MTRTHVHTRARAIWRREVVGKGMALAKRGEGEGGSKIVASESGSHILQHLSTRSVSRESFCWEISPPLPRLSLCFPLTLSFVW